MTFSPVSLLLLIPVAAWLVWAVRRLTRRGLCDCHGEKGKKGQSGAGGCAHCASGCAAATMAARLDELAQKPTEAPPPSTKS